MNPTYLKAHEQPTGEYLFITNYDQLLKDPLFKPILSCQRPTKKRAYVNKRQFDMPAEVNYPPEVEEVANLPAVLRMQRGKVNEGNEWDKAAMSSASTPR